ncbi:2-oxo acid dehydrogenase subunit E2 [Candidatus Gracilibacteria bacterium]|nr:2-oxo acid dehydrogenase subunit E2 [Candidatus Gracilibacteria bacterium]
MAFEFKFPDVGEGIHEGEIVRWRVKVGDEIKEDQPVVEVETAKAIVELPSPKSGTVLAIQGKEGEVIHVGDLLVAIGEKGEKYTPSGTPVVASGAAPEEKQKAPGVVGEIPTEISGFTLPTRSPETHSTSNGAPTVLPRIRKLAQDMGVDLTKVKGTGPGGQIMENDLKAPTSDKPMSKVALPNFEKYGATERVPLKGIRKAIAEHMTQSVNLMPHVTHMDEFDATKLVAKRAMEKIEAEAKGIKLTYLAYIIKASVEALKKHPLVNATIDDATQEIVYKKYFNIGIAVDTPEGLFVPVIKNADQKDLFSIAKEIPELAEKCKNRTIGAADLEGASFTITNIGSIGGIYATPIIPLGQAAILGVMKLKEKPVEEDGKVVIRPIMSFALSFDHRVVDGAEAGRFVNELFLELTKL